MRAAWIWPGGNTMPPILQAEAKHVSAIATEMRTLVARSLEKTQTAQNPAMRKSGITSFDNTRVINTKS